MRRTHRALAMLALSLALVAATTATAVAAPPAPTGIEDQHDRLLRNLERGQAERTLAAVTLARSMERNLTAVPAVGGVAAQPAPRIDTASPGRDVDVLATLLLGLVGGLVGGAAAMAGWTAATRRRLHRVTAAT
jgi:hypothetical protein